MLCKFVLKASFNRKLTHLSIFLSLEKIKCTLAPIHAIRANLDALDERFIPWLYREPNHDSLDVQP